MSDLERWNTTLDALQAHQHRLLQMGRVDAANRLGLAILELTEMSRPAACPSTPLAIARFACPGCARLKGVCNSFPNCAGGRLATFPALPPPAKPSDARNGCFLDKMWACKVCDGELPDGHTANCDIYQLETKVATLVIEIQASHKAIRFYLASGNRDDPTPCTCKYCTGTPAVPVASITHCACGALLWFQSERTHQRCHACTVAALRGDGMGGAWDAGFEACKEAVVKLLRGK